MITEKPGKHISWVDQSEQRAAVVKVDGEVYRSVLECLTGPSGWIEYLVKDEQGKHLLLPNGDIVRRKVHGLVEVTFK